MRLFRSLVCIAVLTILPAAGRGAEKRAGDPAGSTPAPAWAVGQSSRAADLDAMPGFAKPPAGFGTVPFFWWLGDPLTKERLAWELAQMEGMCVSGYQINYAHSDRGGRSYGLTYPSEPALFSEDWWKLVGWFMNEAKKQGAAVSLSDYTLGFGQGWCVDEILRDHPEVLGQKLGMGKDGKIAPQIVPMSINPMHPMSGKWYADAFFGPFERRFPGEGGRGLNFFFSDELSFGIGGNLWSEQFAQEFRKRKGYDITPELAALFKDIGPRTPKIRMDYSDVMVALTEENFFVPLYDWHQQRGMTMGCDHGGRGQNVVEFGDYFRTQRWNQGPGSDQPGLGKSLIKAKVGASIAHLYQRPRVWLEGFYGSGWGTTSAGFVDATFANYVMGYNLLSMHGMYYSTHGGWWEWAPPDNTFRMPYWKHLRGFMQCVERLSYVLTQGHHRCDVAILYPVAPMEAGMDGRAAVDAAFRTGQSLYGKGVDFDFMDFESLDRATIAGKELHVSGEIYKVLIVPAMKAARHSTLEKALAFHRAGGIVLAVGALPEASDRMGRDDPQVAAIVKELFPAGPTADVFARLPARDYDGPGMIQHRRIGPRDFYAIYNAPKDAECFFRAAGKVELWDPWTGTARPLAAVSQDAGGTRLRLPLSEKEIQLIVFSPGKAEIAAAAQADAPTIVPVEGDWDFEIQPTCDNRFGDFHWPPTQAMIGAEARRLRYSPGARVEKAWIAPGVDDSRWPTVTCGFGQKFWKLGPLPDNVDAAALEAELAKLAQLDPARPVEIAGKSYRWTSYDFSWQWGIENDPGHQGYHGLKEEVHDEFIALGKLKASMTNTSREKEEAGSRYYLWTTALYHPPQGKAYVKAGGTLPSGIWVNGKKVEKIGQAVAVEHGPNPLLLRYDGPGKGYCVLTMAYSEDTPAEFSDKTSWIWFPDEKVRSDRFFRRTFQYDDEPTIAFIRVTCDNGYRLFLNGKELGQGAAWERIQQYDVAKLLKKGVNVIAIVGHNDGGDAGLIAELRAVSKKAEVRVGTDATWRCSRTEAPGWLEAGFDDANWTPAQAISSYKTSLWYTHQHGPPKLDAPTAITDSLHRTGTMASRWHGDHDLLVFDPLPGEQQFGWYRFISPPGLKSMTITVRGNPFAWANGQRCEVEPASAPNFSESGARAYRVTVQQPSAGPVPIVLGIEHRRGFYGGEAFPEPIRLECGAGTIALGDWSKIDGLACYSGGVCYRKSVKLDEVAGRQVVLDLGQVAASVEVRVNGQLAGIRVAPPWKLDITRLVKPGENRIEALVCNTLANHYTTVPTRYRGSTVSGLLGPVRIELTAQPSR